MNKNRIVGLTHLSKSIRKETYVHSIPQVDIPNKIQGRREGVYDRMVRVEYER